MKLRMFPAALALGFAALVQAPAPAKTASDIPVSLQAPAGEKLLLKDACDRLADLHL